MQCGSIKHRTASPHEYPCVMHHLAYWTVHVCWYLQPTELLVPYSICKNDTQMRTASFISAVILHLSLKFEMHTEPFSCGLICVAWHGFPEKCFKGTEKKARGIRREINRAREVMTFWLGHIWWLQRQFGRSKLLKLQWFFNLPICRTCPLTYPFVWHPSGYKLVTEDLHRLAVSYISKALSCIRKELD